MHELSIMMSIVDIAQNEARKAEADAVESVELDIGTMAGIELSALEFGWEVATKNTCLENAQLHINSIQATALCMDCHHTFSIGQLFDTCPNCNSYFTEILTGKELKIKSLVVHKIGINAS